MNYTVLTKKQIGIGFLIVLWLIVLIVVIVMNITSAASAYERRLPIYSVSSEEKKCALTFNCAWGDETTDEVLSVLRKYNVKGTFFFVGSFAEKYPQSVRKIANDGHELANHSYSHLDPVKLGFTEIVKDISDCNAVIESITGKKPELYRAPSGSYDDKTVEAAESLGMYAVQWDVDSIDWKNISSDEIYDRITLKTQPGSIILFHLGKENTAKALPGIIEFLQDAGFSIVPAGELIYRENYEIAYDGTQMQKIG